MKNAFYVFIQDDQKHWQIVFWLAGGGYFIGGIIYMILASGEVQYWNDTSTRTIKTMNEIEQEANSRRNREYQGKYLISGLITLLMH